MQINPSSSTVSPWVFAMQSCEEIKTNRRENPHLAVASSTEVYKCIYYKICILFTGLAIIVRETTFTRIDNILIFLKQFEHIHSKNKQRIKNLYMLWNVHGILPEGGWSQKLKEINNSFPILNKSQIL